MNFVTFRGILQNHVDEMIQPVNNLFSVDVDKDEMWNLYLDSYAPEHNKMFRKRREHDCSCCRNFIKNFGNVVTIQGNKITSIWDFNTNEEIFQPVLESMRSYIHSKIVNDVFTTNISKFGTDHNFERSDDGVIQWDHFYFELPQKFIYNQSDTIDSVKGRMRDIRNVFKRSLDEISKDAIDTVLELISQNSLYKGEEWKSNLQTFRALYIQYHKLSNSEKELFAWEQSTIVGPVIGKIRNHSIGTLLTDLTEGTDLDTAVRKYEVKVAPTNYKRPKAIFTKKMVEDAKKTIEELGYGNSLGRRFATINDITIPNVLFGNKDVVKKLSKDVFDDLASEVAVSPKSFDKIEQVSIEVFERDILPTARSIEVFVENKHKTNFVSLIGPKEEGTKGMLKWDNNFSWAYTGNITDSTKELVKNAGGKVDGVLRFSPRWNDSGKNSIDFDAHCTEPNGNEISFRAKSSPYTMGQLDVDIINPGSNVAVENITWAIRDNLREGIYKFFVHNFSSSTSKEGFSAQIEFDGQIFDFEYNKPLRGHEQVEVAYVKYSRSEGFTLIEKLPSSTSSREIWNLSTNNFYPVSVCMYSPNYWDKQQGIGNRHYFFMIDGCKNPEEPNGFFNEYLKEDLMKHKRVFEALGSKMRVEYSDNQLSGLGFSSTKRNEIICKVEGSFTRTIKVIF